jgi:methylmalonyl-CoA/ethylmalonyl-CoA epimerase
MILAKRGGEDPTRSRRTFYRIALIIRKKTRVYMLILINHIRGSFPKGVVVKVKRIDHIGIAVKDSEAASDFLTSVFGARKLFEDKWKYRDQEFRWAYFLIGDRGIVELISSAQPDNFINKFIEKHGEGLHHVTIQVENLDEAVAFLREKGIKVLDVKNEDPHWKEAFISPGDSFGVLFQIAEFDEDYWESMI